ncbi:zinc transporter ZIP3 isoform X2 [Orussus abietinus]|uniref:zinc transporter ZIP3 isoform X2 n=1 Tax=Orussus abietinus TaxID=222816 RepID=UPI00062608E3|nr:zinc transporter ZIP3 isoform X2 [Orussus abietinus]
MASHSVQPLHVEGESAPEYSSVFLAKGVTMVVLCSVSIVMGLLPIHLAKRLGWNPSDSLDVRSSRAASLLLGFGGGVLFCTAFLHLLPEVGHGIDDLVMEGSLPDLGFSLAETLTCLGFFAMYLVEETVHDYSRRRQEKARRLADANKSTNDLVENGQNGSLSSSRAPDCGAGCSPATPAMHSHLPSQLDDGTSVNALRGLLIVLGLSVHELFEGLAIGLESSANYVWYMFAAVAAHKFVIAFCIGLELVSCKSRRYFDVLYICVYAVISPVGIGVGMLLVGGGTAASSGVAAVALQGIATGTLLYIVFFEILHKHRDGLCQFLSVIVGWAAMFALQLSTAHSHSHSHSHSAPDDEAAHAVKADVAGALASTIDQLGTWNQSGLAVSRNVSGSP